MNMPAQSPKQQFLDGFRRETATTLKVLRAFPPDKLDLKPAPRSKTARELAWLFVIEQALAQKALTTGFDWSAPPAKMPDPPDSLDAIIKATEDSFKQMIALVENTPDSQMGDVVKFPVGPHQMGDVPKLQFLWFLLCDQIHHRGQMTVYLRVAGAKVPSIYGPSGDEPWF